MKLVSVCHAGCLSCPRYETNGCFNANAPGAAPPIPLSDCGARILPYQKSAYSNPHYFEPDSQVVGCPGVPEPKRPTCETCDQYLVIFPDGNPNVSLCPVCGGRPVSLRRGNLACLHHQDFPTFRLESTKYKALKVQNLHKGYWKGAE